MPEWVVIPGGNLGNVSALGAGFEMLHALGLVALACRSRVTDGDSPAAITKLRESLSPDFEEIACGFPGYEDGDRYPTLVFRLKPFKLIGAFAAAIWRL